MSNIYESPLKSRYASQEMLELFSEDTKFKTWRKLWIALAEAEKELGLNINDEQVEEMRKFQDNINYEIASEKEKELLHDVMAHVYAFGEQCPNAKPIIHLGATSCYVGDNTDLILMYEGLSIIKNKLLNIISELSKFSLKYRDMPTLGFTHFQPAQLVTVGKRACLWLQDLMIDLEHLKYEINNAKLLGSKGTTGTQASFLELFEGNHEKVKQLETKIANKMGYDMVFDVSGQTYPRKIDSIILNILSGIAQSASKFANDIRLLQHLKEIEEPFEEKQVGSSAMAYKRNPMRCERICGLARHVIINSLNPEITASVQWFERTLDDSSNKRISIPESFLAVDSILNIYLNVVQGLVVNPKIIERHVSEELPFMATENLLMIAVKNGGDRQILHERIRIHSMEAAKNVKQHGLNNDLINRIKNDNLFKLLDEDFEDILNPKKYTGRSGEQVKEYIEEVISPLIEKLSNISLPRFGLHV